MAKKSYFRPEIDGLDGYVPGEQPKMAHLVKLNTNENPYSPSPRVAAVLRDFDVSSLRRYPNPSSDSLRRVIAESLGTGMERIIVGNGSDDLLTMIFRAFTSPALSFVMPSPTYSLYPVLAAMQGAPVKRIELDRESFALPEDFAGELKGANLLALARPNAPTGNLFPKEAIRNICKTFDGIVLIDEAYADFAPDNCMDLALEFDHVIVMRTFSKSYALAGIRLGYAVGAPELIEGLMKLKDSYNVDAVTQAVGEAAFRDREYFAARRDEVKESRRRLTAELEKRGFKVIPSATNFLFASPPDGDGERCFRSLRSEAVIVRYFKDKATAPFVRITIGTPEEIARLLEVIDQVYHS